MRRSSIAVAALSIALLGTACGPGGSGELATEARTLPAFDRISIGEGLDLSLEVVPGASQQVSVTYDDNLLGLIGTEVVDGELRIQVIDSFRVSGGGRFVTVVIGDLEVLHAGSGADVRATGTIDQITVSADGGASMDLSLLEARQVVVVASGGAFVAVLATESVGGTASGGAEVMILGDPSIIDVDHGPDAAVSRG